MGDFVKIEDDSAKKKNVSLKGLGINGGIKIVRKKSDLSSGSSSGSSYSDSESDVTASSYSDSGSSVSYVKKKKKIIRRKRVDSQPNYQDYSAFSNPKKVRPIKEESELESESDSGSDNGSEAGSIQRHQDSPKESFEQKQSAKQDLLYKIGALESKGYTFTKKFSSKIPLNLEKEVSTSDLS